ncbi:MAG: hypothetical protein V2B18_20880 [Pseudomonadota bacterium]
MMEVATLGNRMLSECPYCNLLFDVTGMQPGQAITELMKLHAIHLDESPECQAKQAAIPTLNETFESFRGALRDADDKCHQHAIDNHPDNGRSGYWRVSGIRHEATTQASSAGEAVEKCGEVVRDWEYPAVEFIGDKLPDVF